jgi:two-component system, sensor histidine kinase LadS
VSTWIERARFPRYASVAAFALLAALWISLNALSSARPPPSDTLSLTVDEIPDPNDLLSLDDVTRGVTVRFRRLPAVPPPPAAAEWYRFVPPRDPAVPIVLFVNGGPDEADLFFRRADGSYGVVPFGVRRPFSERRFASPYAATQLTPSMRGSTLYLHVYGAQPGYGFFVPIALSTGQTYDQRLLIHTSGTLAFVGFFTAMGLVSGFLGLYLRERMFALHAMLMAAVIVWDLTEKFLAWEFLWPFASIDFRTAESLTFSLYLLALLLFARSFLSLGQTLPVLDRILWVVVGLNVVIAFIAHPFMTGNWLAAVQGSLLFLPFVLLPIAGAIRWRAGYPQARFFVLGFAGLFVVFLTAALFGNAPLSPWAIDTGVAFESLLFQFAIADRMLSMMRERDRAQRTSLVAKEQLAVNQRDAIDRLERYNEAFSRFVPREFLTQLGRADLLSVRLGDGSSRVMTVLFADIRGFTRIAESLSPKDTFAFINDYLSHVGPVIRAHGGFVDKYIGDAILALFPDSADRALDAAIELHQAVRRFNESRARSLLLPIAIGVGLHRGSVMLGTIGEEQRFETTVIADAVNVASRLEGVTKTFDAHIIASADVVDALTNRAAFRLRPLNPVRVHGLSRPIAVFEVCDADEPELLLHKVATLEIFESALRAYTEKDFQTSKGLFEEIVRRNEKDATAAYFLEQSTREIENPV